MTLATLHASWWLTHIFQKTEVNNFSVAESMHQQAWQIKCLQHTKVLHARVFVNNKLEQMHCLMSCNPPANKTYSSLSSTGKNRYIKTAQSPVNVLFRINITICNLYHQRSNKRRTRSPNLNVSRLVLQLSLPLPLNPCVKSRMKM